MLSHVLEGPGAPAPVILYLHGLGIAGWCWDPVRAALPQFAALVPDLPGHGRSAGVPWHSIAETAERVADVVDTLPRGRPVHVTGHSLGAYVGWILVHALPERSESAALSGFHVGDLSYRALFRLAYVANGLAFAALPLLKRLASVMGDAQTAARFVEGAKVIRPRTIRRAGIQVVDFQPASGLDAPPLPITAIAGEREPAAIRATPGKLAERNRNVRAVLLPGRGHLWPITESQTYADILSEHVSGCVPVPSAARAP